MAFTGHSPTHFMQRMHSGDEGALQIAIPMGQTDSHLPQRTQASDTRIRTTETFPKSPQAAPSGHRYLQNGLSTEAARRMTTTARELFQKKRKPVR